MPNKVRQEITVLFKEVCQTDEEYNEIVRDSMRAYSIVKQEMQQRSSI